MKHLPNLRLALNLFKQSKFDDAAALLKKLIKLNQNDTNAIHLLGLTCIEQGNFHKGVTYLEKLISLRNDHAEGYFALGNLLREKKQFLLAIDAYNKGLRLNHSHFGIWNNKGVVLKDLNQINEAEECFDRALLLNPGFQNAHWNKGLILLLNESLQGWQHYEAGLITGARRIRDLMGFRLSSHAEIPGKTIFVYPEQGFGDFIQFCRFVPLVFQIGGRVILEVPLPLKRLFAANFSFAEIVTKKDATTRYDYHCSVMSLPSVLFSDSIDWRASCASDPYITANKTVSSLWKQKIRNSMRFKVGIAWSGNPNQGNDTNRSIPFEIFSAILSLDCDFYVVQKDVRPYERDQLGASPCIQYQSEFSDFADTAAFVDGMDLIITVCTSIAHLSGAMGKPTWVLISTPSDWRWGRHGATSHWYKSTRIFRQETPGDWRGVINKVKQELQKIVDTYL